MSEPLGLPEMRFTQDEWDRTPESVRRFVLQLSDAAETILGQVRHDAAPEPAEPPAAPAALPGQVVLVSDRPLSREAKIAWGLHRAGWDVVLLCSQPPAFDARAVCSTVEMYRTAKEAVALARRYSPIAFHVFSCWSYDVAAALIRNGIAPVIHDNYDVMGGLVREELQMRNFAGQAELERYCVEHADGHCCRSLETQTSMHRLRYDFRGPRMLLTDMCWGAGAPNVTKLSAIDGERHIVYCGNLFKGGPEAPDANNFHYITAAALSSRAIHYHIYPSSEELAQIYRAGLGRYLPAHGNPAYVHVNSPVPPDRLIDELARYDAGVQVLSRSVDGSPSDPTYEIAKFNHAAANKVFDYADAGIPVIIHNGSFQRSIVRRYRLGATVRTIEGIADVELPASVTPPRALTVEANIPRLVTFYRAVAASRMKLAA